MNNFKLKKDMAKLSTGKHKYDTLTKDKSKREYYLRWENCEYGTQDVKGDPVIREKVIESKQPLTLTQFEYEVATKYFRPTNGSNSSYLSESDLQELGELLSVAIPYGKDVLEAFSTPFVEEIEMNSSQFKHWQKFNNILESLYED